jgi:hypothetical protein
MMDIIFTALFAVGPGRNDCLGAQFADACQEMSCVESFVSNDCVDIVHSDEQIFRLSDVMSLAPGETKSSQVAEAIHHGMDLCAQSRARTANTLLSLFFDALAACWCARTIVLSRNASSKSASSESRAKTACHTPLSAHRANRLNVVFHGPNAIGRSRQGAPVRAIQCTASTNNRLSAPLRPRSPCLPWRSPSIRTHWSSRNNNLGILSSSQKTECEHISPFVNRGYASNVHRP